MVWGASIVAYLYLAGLGSGALLCLAFRTTTMQGFSRDVIRASAVPRIVAAATVAVSAVCLLCDAHAGLSNPDRLLLVFSNPRSALAWGSLLLVACVGLGLLSAFFAHRERYVPALLDAALATVAAGVAIYSGVFLGTLGGYPFWRQGIVPALFAVSALTTGWAALRACPTWCDGGRVGCSGHDGRVLLGKIILLLVELLLAAVLAVVALGEGGAAAASARALVVGDQAVVFWGGFVGCGLISLICTGGKGCRGLSVASSLFAQVSGFALRWSIVFAALPSVVSPSAML